LYFEELKQENNTEIGTKDIFEIGSISDWLDNTDESHGKRARCGGSPEV